MSNSPWKIDAEKLTITFDCKKFRHIYYAPNKEVFDQKVTKLLGPPKIIKLHLACGNERLENYVNMDIQPSKFTDKVCDCTKLSDFADNSVDEIVTYHFIEHLTAAEIRDAIVEWRRVLKKGGKLVIECPNLEEICRIFLQSTDEERYKTWNKGPAIINHIYGGQANPYEFHKFGFTKSVMQLFLQEMQFQNIYFGESHKDYRVPCIHVECIKV